MAKPGEDEDQVDDVEDVVDEDQTDDTDDSGDDDGDTGTDDKGAAKARREAANLRKRLRATEQRASEAEKAITAKILKALGAEDPNQVTPEQLREQTAAQANKLRERTVELGVVRAAVAAGANPEALLDSRSFMAGLADLDPEDSDYTAQVADAVKSAIKKNPSLKGKAQAAGSSGGAHGSGSGTGSGNQDDVDEDADAAYKAVLKRNQRRRS